MRTFKGLLRGEDPRGSKNGLGHEEQITHEQPSGSSQLYSVHHLSDAFRILILSWPCLEFPWVLLTSKGVVALPHLSRLSTSTGYCSIW